MMKKLIVLMLVLGLATSANAALTLTLNPSGAEVLSAGSYNVDIVSNEDDILWVGLVGFPDKTYGSITGVVALANAGDDASVSPYGDGFGFYDVYGIDTADMSEPFDSVDAGSQFTITVNFTGAAIGQDLKLVLMDTDLIELDSRTFQGVPEPMTIALLGLGGLFLRRRK